MSDIAVDISEWDELDADILYLAMEALPRECKKFMGKEGRKLKATTKKLGRKTIHKKTGNYFKSIKGTKGWKNSRGGYGVRVQSTRPPAYHGHLLEYGHDIKIRGKYEPKNGKKRTEAFNIMHDANKMFANQYYGDCQGFVDELVENGMRGR